MNDEAGMRCESRGFVGLSRAGIERLESDAESFEQEVTEPMEDEILDTSLLPLFFPV